MLWQRVSLKIWLWTFIGAIVGTAACAVDDRQLSSARVTADMGGAGTGSGGCGAVQLCDFPDGRDSGTLADASINVAPCTTGLCPDLNNNNVPDQTETLAPNPTFDTDISNWAPETGIGLGWNSNDACGRCDSGSIAVTNQFAGTSGGFTAEGATQCLQATPNRVYLIMGRAQPAASAIGEFGLQFFASTDCSGDKLAVYNSPPLAPESDWQLGSTSGTAPSSAQSVAIRLIVTASAPPSGGIYAYVLFDNILVLTQ
jgi:hypothetical protein